MSTRLFALLFTALFAIGAIPVFFLQPFGFASAGITVGFTVPLYNIFHVTALVAAGVFSVCVGGEIILLMPLCVLLMLSIGAFMNISPHDFHAVQGFIVGAILLFSLCVSMIRRRAVLLYLMPAALWCYFCGGAYMRHLPPITAPLFFLMGIVLCWALLLAMGVALGITIEDRAREGMERFKASHAYATFMSFF